MEATESPERRTVKTPFLTGLAFVVALDAFLILGGWLLGLSPFYLLAVVCPSVGLVVAVAGWMHIRRVGPEWWFALGALVASLLSFVMVSLAGMPVN